MTRQMKFNEVWNAYISTDRIILAQDFLFFIREYRIGTRNESLVGQKKACLPIRFKFWVKVNTSFQAEKRPSSSSSTITDRQDTAKIVNDFSMNPTIYPCWWTRHRRRSLKYSLNARNHSSCRCFLQYFPTDICSCEQLLSLLDVPICFWLFAWKQVWKRRNQRKLLMNEEFGVGFCIC